MHSLINSLRKRLYTWRLSSDRCARTWDGVYWEEIEGERVVSCARCPKFSVHGPRCSIRFGSLLRKCVSAAQEANLHSLYGLQVLEIGFGRHSIPRQLVQSAGGVWTGIEPMYPASGEARLGQACAGHVGSIPFPNATFDRVVGIQTLEHWEEPLPGGRVRVQYAEALREVARVLKPNGRIYFDAPMHLHGHEMFVAGDVRRIRAMFENDLWQDVVVERWREHYAPLARYPTPAGDAASWRGSVSSYPESWLQDIRENRSVWLLTIKAVKRC